MYKAGKKDHTGSMKNAEASGYTLNIDARPLFEKGVRLFGI